jgi:cytoskeletal protein CcmA (bactofilin family)
MVLGRGRDVKREKPPGDAGEIKAFLGEGTEFKGVLSFEGTVRVDGYLEGEIVGDDLLIVGEPGLIRARIEVSTVVNSGRIEGNIQAKRRVELLATSLVIGNIKTPSLVVAEGATFNGSCEMARPAPASGSGEAHPEPPART